MQSNFNNNKYKSLTVLASCLVLLSACNKYLNVQPKGFQLLTTVTDYDRWLSNDALENYLPGELNQLTDLVDNPTISAQPTAATDLAYLWKDQFDPNSADVALIYPKHYKVISLFNTVIQGIDAATGGTDEQKNALKAEALLGRAFEYLYLVNEYGKPYDSATASADPAVPFVTSDDIATPTPARSSVQDIYNHIISDINEAIPSLPQDNSANRFRGSVAAGYSVLARTYLYMRNYPQARHYAELALVNGPDSIVDYNNPSSFAMPAIPALGVSPYDIYARLPVNKVVSGLPTMSFMQSFDKNDLRLYNFYTISDPSFQLRGSTSYNNNLSTYSYANWGTSVVEMQLIIAEAAARSGDLTIALQQLDEVRKCRIATAGYLPYQSDNQDSVLQHVLNERTFEFAFTGMRWFDMRRLDKEGKMGTVYRYDGDNNIIATLAPGSPRYTLQIPIQVLVFNSGWPQNP